MPKTALTDRLVAGAKAPADRQLILRDATVKGLALRVSPGGTRAWFVVYSRPADGARIKLALDEYPRMTLTAARKAARRSGAG